MAACDNFCLITEVCTQNFLAL